MHFKEQELPRAATLTCKEQIPESGNANITSSRTIIWTWSTFATPFLMRSRILPGVAITTCTAKTQKHTRDELQLELWKSETKQSGAT